MSRAFGWDLPPGVTSAMIEGFYDDREAVRCDCGRFLKDMPDGYREWCVIRLCDGRPSMIEGTYDDAVLAIIGEEYRGGTFKIAYPPACGSIKGEPGTQSDGGTEIRLDEIEGARHEPHWYADPWGDCKVALRECACGRVHEELLT